MKATDEGTEVRELDHRDANGLEISLLWDPLTDTRSRGGRGCCSGRGVRVPYRRARRARCVPASLRVRAGEPSTRRGLRSGSTWSRERDERGRPDDEATVTALIAVVRAHGRIRRLSRRARGGKHEGDRNGVDERLPRGRRREKELGRPSAHGRGDHRHIRAVGPALEARRRSGSERNVLLEHRHRSARALQPRDRVRPRRRRCQAACGCPVAAQPVTWLRRSSNDSDSCVVIGAARPGGARGSPGKERHEDVRHSADEDPDRCADREPARGSAASSAPALAKAELMGSIRGVVRAAELGEAR